MTGHFFPVAVLEEEEEYTHGNFSLPGCWKRERERERRAITARSSKSVSANIIIRIEGRKEASPFISLAGAQVISRSQSLGETR